MPIDVALKNLKPDAQPYKRSDGGELFVIVPPNGRKLWWIASRITRKQKLLSARSHPEVRPHEARGGRRPRSNRCSAGTEGQKIPETSKAIVKPNNLL